MRYVKEYELMSVVRSMSNKYGKTLLINMEKHCNKNCF